MIDGTKYPLAFTLNVMEEIQEEYKTMDNWIEKIQGENFSIKALKFGFKEMINEGIDIENEALETKRKFVDMKKVGRIITEIGIEKLALDLGEIINISTENEESKNA